MTLLDRRVVSMDLVQVVQLRNKKPRISSISLEDKLLVDGAATIKKVLASVSLPTLKVIQQLIMERMRHLFG